MGSFEDGCPNGQEGGVRIMWAFLGESLQLLYYAYFNPSALRVRLNKAAPHTEYDTTFFRISWNIWRLAGARRFLFQCSVWWLIGLLPFWWLAWGAMPWEGGLFISGSLLLAAWSIALFDLSLGLAFPLIAGLVWGLKPEMWPELQARIAPWLRERTVGLLAAGLLLSVALVGGAVGASTLGHRRLVSWLAGLATFVAGSVASGAAGGVAGVVVFVVALVVAGYVAFIVADQEEEASGLAGGMVGGVAGILTFVAVVVFVLAFVVAFVVAGGVVGGVVFVAVLVVAGYVTFKVAGGMAVGVVLVAAGGVMLGLALIAVGVVAGVVAFVVALVVSLVVAGVVTLPLAPALGFALELGVAFSPRRPLWFGFALASIAAAPFIGPRGWGMTGLAWLSFLVGYFRLPLYPIALLAMALGDAPDEIVGLRFYGFGRRNER